MRTVLLAVIAALFWVVSIAAAAKNITNTSVVTVSMSSTTATGLVIGVALICILSFGLNMMQGIQISDTITEAATESN